MRVHSLALRDTGGGRKPGDNHFAYMQATKEGDKQCCQEVILILLLRGWSILLIIKMLEKWKKRPFFRNLLICNYVCTGGYAFFHQKMGIIFFFVPKGWPPWGQTGDTTAGLCDDDDSRAKKTKTLEKTEKERGKNVAANSRKQFTCAQAQ